MNAHLHEGCSVGCVVGGMVTGVGGRPETRKEGFVLMKIITLSNNVKLAMHVSARSG